MGRIRTTSLTNPTYRLDELDRRCLGMLAAMNLWPKQHLADAYGVSRKTVQMCLDRYQEEPRVQLE